MKILNKLALLILLIINYACTTSHEAINGYKIELSISGETNSHNIILSHMVDGIELVTDSTVLIEGHATLSGTLEGLPEGYSIKIEGESRKISFFLENSAINIEAHIDSLQQAKISGSLLNDRYTAFENSQKNIRVHMNSLFQTYEEAQAIDDTLKMTEIDSIYYSLEDNLKTLRANFISNNRDNILGPFQTSRVYYHDEDVDEIDSLLNLFDPVLNDSKYVKRLLLSIEKWSKLSIGMEAPNFIQADSSNRQVSLSDFRGKYLLVDFWASWCGPCREENPNIVAAYEKYHEQGFDILGVSLDTDRDKWLKAIKKDNLTWNHVSDLNGWQNEVSVGYGVRAIPYSLLIGPDGKIISKNLRQEMLHEAIAKALAL